MQACNWRAISLTKNFCIDERRFGKFRGCDVSNVIARGACFTLQVTTVTLRSASIERHKTGGDEKEVCDAKSTDGRR